MMKRPRVSEPPGHDPDHQVHKRLEGRSGELDMRSFGRGGSS